MELVERGVGAGSCERSAIARPRGCGSGPPSACRRSIRYWYSAESPRRAEVGRVARRRATRRGSRRAGAAGRAGSRSCSLVIFLIWCVALRPSTSGPSVQPLTVLARITVGAPILVLGCDLVGGVQLAVVVPAAGKRAQLVVGQVLDHACAGAGRGRRSARGCRRPTRPRSAGTRRRRCVFICSSEHAVVVAGEQLVPLRAPDHLDDVPAGAAEDGLELLDDLAVAAHRAVEALQVAVDDPDQVVELLAARRARSRRGSRARRISPSPTKHHTRASVVSSMPSVLQVPVEPGVVDRR